METLKEKHKPQECRHHGMLRQCPVLLRKAWRKKKCHLFLFSDVLVVSNSVHKEKFKIKYIIPLKFIWVSDYGSRWTDHSGTSKSLILQWPKKRVVATFRSRDEKQQWHIVLLRCFVESLGIIKKRKRTAWQPFTKDIPGSTSACA
ncbi:rho GTPase-activating protein 20-like [Microtus ochrogaster]|uniref:Rho GTPase-activating protein 20-like n=1 Tax=Microtus ochrogaster TaxID=79684 RepID=A0ABM0L1W3_MICOH|nr:rho GTPase-activating protein 20-like [Microtus ochrogaster]